jgi:hypothetical protein
MRSVQISMLLLGIAAGFLPGCGQAPEPNAREVFPTLGFVTFKGKPIPDASIRLHPMPPPDDGKPVFVPRGSVDESGMFVLSTYRQGDGAPPGDYRVSFSWVGPLDGVDEDEEDRRRERLPRKYNSAETSGVMVTVTAGENLLDEIALN